MKQLQRSSSIRRGFSLLELMAAATITATLMVSSMVVIRSSYAAWAAHEGDMVKTSAADAVLRHIIRNLRQAASVSSLSDPSDTTGRLELIDADGATHYWEHTGTSDGIVEYNASGAVLAEGIDSLVFTGYESDGVTTTVVADDVHLVRCAITVTLPRGAGESRTVSCCGWIRSW